MRVLIVHYDIHVLAGNVRAVLMLSDVFKFLGHDILILYTNIRPEEAYFWRPESLKRYHTVKYIDFTPRKVVGSKPGERAVVMGDFQIIPHNKVIHQIYDYVVYTGFNYLFTDELSLMGVYDLDVDGAMYIHYPDRPACPKRIKLWCNSSYTKSMIRTFWGRDAVVVYPPIHPEFYNPSLTFKERDIDVIFFGQFYRVKGFDLTRTLASEGLRVVVVGAKVHDYVPYSEGVQVYSNVSVPFYTRMLSRSKVYVHARPGEHLGITIVEAMASGCVPVVHKSGGQWTDVVMRGEYGYGWSSTDELVNIVKRLVKDRSLWERSHERALEGSERFHFRRVADKVSRLLGET